MLKRGHNFVLFFSPSGKTICLLLFPCTQLPVPLGHAGDRTGGKIDQLWSLTSNTNTQLSKHGFWSTKKISVLPFVLLSVCCQQPIVFVFTEDGIFSMRPPVPEQNGFKSFVEWDRCPCVNERPKGNRIFYFGQNVLSCKQPNSVFHF